MLRKIAPGQSLNDYASAIRNHSMGSSQPGASKESLTERQVSAFVAGIASTVSVELWTDTPTTLYDALRLGQQYLYRRSLISDSVPSAPTNTSNSSSIELGHFGNQLNSLQSSIDTLVSSIKQLQTPIVHANALHSPDFASTQHSSSPFEPIFFEDPYGLYSTQPFPYAPNT